MICRKRFIKKLRELKFSFKNRTKSERQELYMRGTTAVYVARHDELLPQLVYAELRKSGVSDEEAKKFIDDPENWPQREQTGD
jgi:hypothetical protein